MRAAEGRLTSSRAGKGAKFESLPVILIVGPAGGAKTTTVVNSGAEPQLLAGHVHDESTVAPTRVGNVWFASDTIFLEAGAALTSDADFWSRVMRRLRPSRLRSAFGRGSQAPRSALVCVDTEALMQAGAGNQFTAVARNLRERLSEAARTLGINLPVYVLFTKIDRISFFAEYVRDFAAPFRP
jgi:type VI secretion system protein ImpL